MLALTLLALALLSPVFGFDWDDVTPLDEYVHRDDGYFSWEELGSFRYDNISTTVYTVNLTSQKWIDETFSTQSVWWHMMGVAIPDVIDHSHAGFLFIDGGSNGEGTTPPDEDFWLSFAAAALAANTRSVGAFLFQVPNQRITFHNDPSGRSRTEDAIIAWTWRTFIDEQGARPEVVLRFPMTKSGKRALDCVNELVAEKIPGADVNSFVVTGGSKRGWTAWSLAATDRRVVAVAPLVMSLMNFEETLMSHYRTLDGAWSVAFTDYYRENLTLHLHDDITVNEEYGLWNYEDMFRYRDRLKLIPILMVSAAGDEFFLLQDSHNWWQYMEGPKYMTMLPNAEHSLVPWYGKVIDTLTSFWGSLLEGEEIADMSWERGETETGGYMTLTTNMEPEEVIVWEAITLVNDTRRDYRLVVGYPPFIHPVLWIQREATVLPDEGDGLWRYYYETDEVEERWVGFFYDVRYRGPVGNRFFLSSEVHFVPDTFPAEPCFGEDCYGYLI